MNKFYCIILLWLYIFVKYIIEIKKNRLIKVNFKLYIFKLKKGITMKKQVSIILIILIIAFLIIAIAGIRFYILIKNYDKKIQRIVINDIDLSKISDGEYIGEYSNFPVSAKVKVIVKNNRIENIIILEHVNGQGKPAEIITQKVIEKQSLIVDVVSGATGSSKVILKAIENALNNE